MTSRLKRRARARTATTLGLASAALCLAAAGCDDGPADPPATGVLRVTTETTGLDVDPDGYVFTRDGVESLAIGLAGSTELPDLAVGTHTIQLSGLAPHCSVVGASTRSAVLARDDTVVVPFEITCPTTLRPDIAAVGDFDGNEEIYLLSLRSLRYVRLTNGPRRDWNPEWSPDGSQIAFTSDAYQTAGGSGVYVMSPNGSDVRLVFEDQLGGSDPDWSPDASQFVLLWDANLYTKAADGTGPLRQLTFGQDGYPQGYADPQWSPDGTRIAFAAGATLAGGIHKRVVVLNVDGSGVFTTVSNPNHDSRSPRWSPDGTRLTYERGGDIYVANADGTGAANVTNTSGVSERTASWTPDGLALLFDAESLGHTLIDRAATDGSGRVRVATLPALFYQLAWNPNP